ncbi:alginate export family protein [Desulforegula conservatrix]|uniref:alginate export family protein n=1 Tax=Desulforegula conservatrix TaxID=153026 RepID=UPI00040C164A|nr:alginate export family protein [Desulforegula conservatrix]
MKKFLIAASVFVAGLTASSAFAFENQFGGEWYSRAYVQRNFGFKDVYAPGEKKSMEDRDTSVADSRTRLFYTAKFNDRFMLVNKFEMGDQIWGDNSKATSNYGKIGADGIAVEVKNTYADFTPVDNLNFKVGTQGTILSRSFLFDDDFAGAVVTYDFGNTKLPFLWMKYNEGGPGKDKNDEDMDAYVLNPEIAMGKITINPMVMYMTQDTDPNKVYDSRDIYYLALNADLKTDNAKAWFTGIYQGGTEEVYASNTDIDVSAYLLAVGGEVSLGKAGLHGQVFYASGDDNAADTDQEAFIAPQGRSYYWSEIMGYGIFDNQFSNNSPGDGITNITAANLGASFQAMPKLTLFADVWYAQLVEDVLAYNGKMENELGLEVDLRAQYMIYENLALDVVGAYLAAGDATGEDDPMEIGTRLELKF